VIPVMRRLLDWISQMHLLAYQIFSVAYLDATMLTGIINTTIFWLGVCCVSIHDRYMHTTGSQDYHCGMFLNSS